MDLGWLYPLFQGVGRRIAWRKFTKYLVWDPKPNSIVTGMVIQNWTLQRRKLLKKWLKSIKVKGCNRQMSILNLDVTITVWHLPIPRFIWGFWQNHIWMERVSPTYKPIVLISIVGGYIRGQWERLLRGAIPHCLQNFCLRIPPEPGRGW